MTLTNHEHQLLDNKLQGALQEIYDWLDREGQDKDSPIYQLEQAYLQKRFGHTTPSDPLEDTEFAAEQSLFRSRLLAYAATYPQEFRRDLSFVLWPEHKSGG